jgi:predicted lipase
MADPSKLALSRLAQAHPDQQRIANTAVSESSIFGLVAWNASALTAIVSIRGTKTIWEWIADIDGVPVLYPPDPGSGLVHMGFELVYEQIRDSIEKLVKGGCPGVQTIWVTGHSLGGALAVLNAFDILKTYGLGIVPQLYTFAGPRVVDPILSGTFNKAIAECNRIVNFMDVVPQVPVPPVYEHVGKQTLVQGGFRPLDVTYAHHLTTYLAGLQKL